MMRLRTCLQFWRIQRWQCARHWPFVSLFTVLSQVWAVYRPTIESSGLGNGADETDATHAIRHARRQPQCMLQYPSLWCFCVSCRVRMSESMTQCTSLWCFCVYYRVHLRSISCIDRKIHSGVAWWLPYVMSPLAICVRDFSRSVFSVVTHWKAFVEHEAILLQLSGQGTFEDQSLRFWPIKNFMVNTHGLLGWQTMLNDRFCCWVSLYKVPFSKAHHLLVVELPRGNRNVQLGCFKCQFFLLSAFRF